MPQWRDYQTYRGMLKHTVTGTVCVLPQVLSPELDNRRDLLVYLPPSYSSGEHRYPVIYMHDGQNLFDAATSYAGEWEVDETMEGLSRAGIEAIVVGVSNAGTQRMAEYNPFGEHIRGGSGNAYLDFVVRTIKPRIDHDFRTLPTRAHTGIAGSSMGGLISLYAFFSHRETFGWVGALSPSLWFAHGAIFSYVALAPYTPGTIYLDGGTEESPRMLPDVRRMHTILREKGYVPGQNLLYVEERGAKHQEMAWARRLRTALPSLLRNTSDRARSNRELEAASGSAAPAALSLPLDLQARPVS